MIFEQLRKLLAEYFEIDVEEIAAETDLYEDLGGDWVDCVELELQIDEKFRIWIPGEEMEKRTTVQSLVDYLEECM